MNIYEINHEIEVILDNCCDEDGVISEEGMARLKELSLAKEEKIENIALMIKNYKADAEKIAAESQKLANRASACAKKVESLKGLLKDALNGEKFKSAKVNIYYQASKSVECTLENIESLPKEYLRYGKPELNKTKIKEALENGMVVEGCTQVERKSLVIR